jgi:transcriptional regulator with XRE-family HTH domain
MMPHGSELQAEAREMRQVEGLSYHEIARRLGVSYTTARRWTIDIELSVKQLSALRSSRVEQAARASATMAATYRLRRRSWQEEGRERARVGDPVHQAGCFLYWAEGSKSRNALSLANSDVNLMRVFVRFLRTEFALPTERFSFRLHLYTGNGLSVRQVEDYWLQHLGLSRRCLRAHSLNRAPAPTSGSKQNKLPYGVGNVVVTKSTRFVQHIYGAIQEYGRFDQPAWLDL